MIKYLVKFTSEKSHAEDLISGKLFMRPASYYHTLETGQGDCREAAISGSVMIYKNSNFPIYCMSAIQEGLIEKDKIYIPEKMYSDFHCDNGFLVLINYDDFAKRLHTVQTNGYSLLADRVTYRFLNFESTKELLVQNDNAQFFIKHPHFYYQQEYRILITKSVYQADETPIDHVIYRFSGDLKDIAAVYEIATLQEEDSYRIIKM